MSLPIVKLGYLLLRTFSKPVANSIKSQAKNKPSFQRACANLAQTYHKWEVNLRHKMNNEKMTPVKPLDQFKAVEMGANFLGEAVIFAIAGSVIFLEAKRTKANERTRRANIDHDIDTLMNNLDKLTKKQAELEESLKHLSMKLDVK